LFVRISTGKIKLIHALQAVLPKNLYERVNDLKISKSPPEEDLFDRIKAYKKGLVISNTTSSEVLLAKCCHPLPGDRLVGYIKRGSGVSVHRVECRQIEGLLPDNIRIIRDIRWDAPKSAQFEASLRLNSTDMKGILVHITKVLLDAGIDIRQIGSDRLPDGLITFKIDVLCSSTRQLEKAMDELKDIEGMIDARRQ